MQHVRVTIKRDGNTVHSTTMAPWEIPIVEYLFDEGNVTNTGETVNSDQDYPEPAQEMVRLMKAYGADVQSGVPHVASVYGTARAGVRALAKAIEEAKSEDETASRARRLPRRRPNQHDSLLA